LRDDKAVDFVEAKPRYHVKSDLRKVNLNNLYFKSDLSKTTLLTPFQTLQKTDFLKNGNP